jgi:hypothetical protein
MLDKSASSYVRYSPAIEAPEKDEAQTAKELMATMRSISEKTLANGGHAMRSVHAKSHGILQGELEVASGLPDVLSQGLFASPGHYPVIMRFSTIPGDILDDSVTTPRGLAVKIIGVKGERLEGSEGDATQDFVLVNGPAFVTASAKQFLGTLKLLAKTTDKVEGLKKVVSATMRGLQHAIVATTGHPSPTVAVLGGQLETHILGDTFFSQAPIRFGDYIAKVAVAPVSPELKALTDAPLNVNGVRNGLREAIVKFFRTTRGVWEVRVQLCTNLAEMPVEDASIVWSEAKSPYQPVGWITVKPQISWSQARSLAVDDGMAFSPWHGLAGHRPLGSIMRVRKLSYAAIKEFRANKNGRKIEEPRESFVLPD